MFQFAEPSVIFERVEPFDVTIPALGAFCVARLPIPVRAIVVVPLVTVVVTFPEPTMEKFVPVYPLMVVVEPPAPQLLRNAHEPRAVVVVTISFPVESVPTTDADFTFSSVMSPFTSNVEEGLVVPIPTLPAELTNKSDDVPFAAREIVNPRRRSAL